MPAIIGTAGWSIPVKDAAAFPVEGTSLERYAARFRGVEINSSFHRSHRASTWQRWADAVPDDFRFAAKLPKTITHQHKLQDCGELLRAFLDESGSLGAKLAVLLVQLPPKLAFDPGLCGRFFEQLGSLTAVQAVCEPRHPSWFEPEADALLASLRVARVAADPALSQSAARPGGWRGLTYWRLHGSPAMYRSAYGPERLAGYAAQIRSALAEGRESWCMFDNTASSAAAGDALGLQRLLGKAEQA